MKRLFCFLVASIMLFSMAFAEETTIFEYRNGIRFGDSRDEVIAKEDKKVEKIGENRVYGDFLTLSGISGCTLNYFFEQDHLKLIEVTYFSENDYRTDVERLSAEYMSIEDGLLRKYGDVSDNAEPYPGSLLKYYGSAKGEMLHFSRRMIPQGDQSVLIDHAVFRHDEYTDRSHYYHDIRYVLVDIAVTQEELVDSDL